MDTNFNVWLADFMTKTGSIVDESCKLLKEYQRGIDQHEQQKTASCAAVKDQAIQAAYKLANTRLASGVPFISGDSQIKQAACLMNSHAGTMNLLDMVIAAVQRDTPKTASADIGQTARGKSGSRKEDDAFEALYLEHCHS